MNVQACDHMCKCPVICQEACDNVACHEATRSLKAEPVTSKDPNSYIQASAETLAETLLSKNSDYAPTGEFSNFEKAAEVASIGVLQVMVAQAAIKMTRIESLMGTQDNPRVVGESLKDSLLDLAGYATIAHAYLEYIDGPDAVDAHQEASTEMREAMEASECFHVWKRVGLETYECLSCKTQVAAEERRTHMHEWTLLEWPGNDRVCGYGNCTAVLHADGRISNG